MSSDLSQLIESDWKRARDFKSVTRSVAESFCNIRGRILMRSSAVVSIEGMGPHPGLIKDSPAYERMNNWIGQMQTLARRKVREYPSIEERSRA